MGIKFKKNSLDLDNPQMDALKSEFLDEITKIKTKLEQEHGPIDNSYSLAVVNFTDTNEQNMVANSVTKEITINLPSYVMGKEKNDKYQRSLNLAHEIAHTITPCVNPSKVTYLEEGLCTTFSEKYVNQYDGEPENYAQAVKLVRKLLDLNPKIIHEMRMKYPNKTISDYTVEELTPFIVLSVTSLLQDLTKPFYDTATNQ